MSVFVDGLAQTEGPVLTFVICGLLTLCGRQVLKRLAGFRTTRELVKAVEVKISESHETAEANSIRLGNLEKELRTADGQRSLKDAVQHVEHTVDGLTARMGRVETLLEESARRWWARRRDYR